MQRYLPAALAAAALPALILGSALAQEAGPEPAALRRDDALRIAAENNLELLAERLARDAAQYGAGAARAGFAPRLVLEATATEDGVGGSGGLAWSTPIGSTLEVAAGGAQALSSGADQAALTVSASQHLLRDGWWSAGAAIDLADAEAALRREEFRAYLNDFLVEVHAAYWEVAFAQADVDIKRRSLERARGQHADTAENIRRGILPETEIYVVEENVVSFEQQLLGAERRLALAQSALAALLQRPPGARPAAADSLDDCAVQLPSAEAAIRTALVDHPALNARRLAIRMADIRLAYARNQALPELDLTAAFSLNGVGGSAAEAWGQVASAEQPALTAGLAFAIPLWLKPARDAVRGGRAEARRQLLALKLEETRLEFAVRDALTALASQQRGVGLAKRLHELAAKKLDAEIEKYRNGVSRLAEVVRFQRELDNALMSFREAQRQLLVDHARFRRTLGQSDRDAGVLVR